MCDVVLRNILHGIHGPLFYQHGGIPLINAPWIHISDGHGTCGEDGMGADFHARPSPASGTKPCAIFNPDRLDNQIKGCPAVIVIAGAQKSALGNTNVAADDNVVEVQKPALLAKPYEIAYFEFPGESDFDVRLDDDTAANFGAERAQDSALQGGQAEWAEPKQK